MVKLDESKLYIFYIVLIVPAKRVRKVYDVCLLVYDPNRDISFIMEGLSNPT